jgi:hypothetical protein
MAKKDNRDKERKERLEEENQFMKMKLMLENGAKFDTPPQEEGLELDPAIENQFLKNIIEFEKQFEEHKTIKVFDKIGKPSHLLPVAKIPDAEIDKAWRELYDLLYKHSIDLSVCSPNISSRELYRFATEELFQVEMDDINVPGMIHGFIYDEFHPDPVYDNSRMALEDCINYILDKEHLKWVHHFRNENLRLNHHYPLTTEELKMLVNRFKDLFDDIQLIDTKIKRCAMQETTCMVSGEYQMNAIIGKERHEFEGGWEVGFELDEQFGYWFITEVRIEQINF